MKRHQIAVLFSGRGSNLDAIIKRSKNEDSLYDVKIAMTDNPEANGIQICYHSGVPCFIAPKNQWKWSMFDALNDLKIDLVVLAGFMRILPEIFCERWKNKCINIHPSLLPKYRGLDTHKRVLESSNTEHGCSVHYVITKLDAGPIIAQSKVQILENESEESLAKRVLEQENRLFPEVIQSLVGHKIHTSDNNVYYYGKKIDEPLSLSILQD